jgi:hypothetical protein
MKIYFKSPLSLPLFSSPSLFSLLLSSGEDEFRLAQLDFSLLLFPRRKSSENVSPNSAARIPSRIPRVFVATKRYFSANPQNFQKRQEKQENTFFTILIREKLPLFIRSFQFGDDVKYPEVLINIYVKSIYLFV